jgi:transcriptional regulator with XRE-family HTH domain
MARRRSRGPDTPEYQQRKEELYMAFAVKVRLARRRAGLTQKELGELAGLAQSYIFEIETMGANLTLEGLDRLASCLKVSMKDLMPENEYEAVTPVTISTLCTTLDRVAEIFQVFTQVPELLSEVKKFTELREHLEQLAKNESEQPEQKSE